jgi:tRNA pseudouridine55 synthase
VAALRRLAVEPFDEQGMLTFETLEAAAALGPEALDRLLLPADAALPAWPSAHLGPADVARLARGQAVPAAPAWPSGPVKVYSLTSQFIAIGEVTEDRRLAPTRVFIR